MGLAKPALRLIAREHKRRPFADPILTLGRQGVYATLDEVKQLLLSEQIAPALLPPDMKIGTNIPSWVGTPYGKYTSDVVFFHLLGLTEVLALDYSDFEEAEIVHDLNAPVPDELRGRFDVIIDSGTSEHVFDVRQVLVNVVTMLRSGGRVIHISPTNNYVNHGFYQFSPTVFFDYYGSNGFINMRGYLIEHGTYTGVSGQWDIFELTSPFGESIASGAALRSIATVFVAEKTAISTIDRIPTQAYYRRLYEQRQTIASMAPSSSGLRAQIKRLLPRKVRDVLLRTVLAPRPPKRRKPWGQKYLGRLD